MLYEAVVDLGFTCGYALAGGSTTPSSATDMKDILKKTGYLTAGRASREMCVKRGWIPPLIVPKKQRVNYKVL